MAGSEPITGSCSEDGTSAAEYNITVVLLSLLAVADIIMWGNVALICVWTTMVV